MESHLITIGIASYNYAAYLPRAFEAIKNQSFKDFELLYCDDGSTDDSISVIEGFIRDNPDMDIRLVKEENKGLLENKNRIIDNACGEYIMFCDADDYMMDSCLERLAAATAGHPDRVIGSYKEIDPDGKVVKRHPLAPYPLKWLSILHHGSIYRREPIIANNVRFEAVPDDICFIQNFNIYCNSITGVHDYVYYWCRHDNSTSDSKTSSEDWKPMRRWGKIIDGMSKVFPKLSDKKDIDGFKYFLIKCYYFHVWTAASGTGKEVGAQYAEMRDALKSMIPDYKAFSTLKIIFSVHDTTFATCATFANYVLDKLGLLKPLLKIKAFVSSR